MVYQGGALHWLGSGRVALTGATGVVLSIENHTMKRKSQGTNFKVVLCFERGLDERDVRDVVTLFEWHPGPVSVSNISRPLELRKRGPKGTLLWADAFAAIQSLRESEGIPAESFVQLLTTTNNENNWYAATEEGHMRNGFCHLGDFKWATSAPSSAVAAHYLLTNLFDALVEEAGVPWLSLYHEVSRGCFYDFCEDKKEVAFKLRTADLCSDCLPRLQSIGIPNEFLSQTIRIMEAIRRQALNTKQFLPSEASFHAWPFPVAITRHKAVQATNQLLRFMLLLDHFDSLVRYFYIAHEVVEGRSPVIQERPSLGWWVNQLARSLRGADHFREVVAIAQQERVVSIRNERRGHGWMSASDDAYSGDAKNLERVLDEIEQELRPFLENYRLIVPRQFRLQEGSFVVEGDHLMGSNILHPPFKLQLDSDPRSVGLVQENQVYLTDSNMKRFHKIAPYIQYVLCPTCNHPRVLITNGGSQFIDVFMGHLVQLGGNC